MELVNLEETKQQLQYLKRSRFELVEGDNSRKNTYMMKVTNAKGRKMSKVEPIFTEVTVDNQGSFSGLPEQLQKQLDKSQIDKKTIMDNPAAVLQALSYVEREPIPSSRDFKNILSHEMNPDLHIQEGSP